MMINKLYSHLLFILAGIIWGASFAYQLNIVQNIGAIDFTFYTFTISFVALLLFLIVKREKLLYGWRSGLVLGLALAGLETLQMLGLKMSGATATAFLSNIGMILVPLFGALIFHHKLKKIHLVTLCIAIIGLYYFTETTFGINLGDMFLLISSFFMAMYFLFSESFEQEKNNRLVILLMQSFFVVSLICFCFIYKEYGSFRLLPTYDLVVYGELIIQAVLFTLLPYGLIHYASKASRDIDIAVFGGLVEPVSGGVFAYYVLHERVAGTQFVGLCILLLAFALGVYGINKRRQSQLL